MDYELAKQLKDGGSPQAGESERFLLSGSQEPHIKHTDGITKNCADSAFN